MCVTTEKHFICLSKQASSNKKVLRRLLKTKLKLMCWNSTYADAPPLMLKIYNTGAKNERRREPLDW